MSEMKRAKRVYPNLPDDFRHVVRQARLKKGLTMQAVANALGLKYPAAIEQYESGKRNFNYERAVQFRDYLGLDYDLPLPRLEDAEPITRRSSTPPIESEVFHVIVDGELIRVLTYRRLGKALKATMA